MTNFPTLSTEAIWRTSQIHPLFTLLSFRAVAAIYYRVMVRVPRLLRR